MAGLMRCNVCFRQPGRETSRFYVTNCGHVICEACLMKGKKDECSVCRSHCHTILLSNETSPDIKILFMDINVLCKNYSKEFTQVIDFQASHRRKLLAHYKEKIVKLEETVKDLTQQLKSLRSSQSYNPMPASSVLMNIGSENRGAFSPYSYPVSQLQPNSRPAESVDFGLSVPKKKNNFTISGPTRLSLISPPRERCMAQSFTEIDESSTADRSAAERETMAENCVSMAEFSAPPEPLITEHNHQLPGHVPYKSNTTGSLRSSLGTLQPSMSHQLSQSVSQTENTGSWNFSGQRAPNLLSQTPIKARQPITLTNILQRRH